MFERFLKLFIRTGNLTLIDWQGRQHQFGDGEGPAMTVRIHGKATSRALFLNPRLKLGEAYMDGTLTIEQGSLYDFIDLCGVNQNLGLPPSLVIFDKLDFVWRRLAQLNSRLKSRRNVAHHYDLDRRLYDLFLDTDRQYSCAYFASRDMTLEEAQEAKKLHIAHKLLLKPGQRVLDIGCGWGGLALTLAREANIEVLGITLSAEQLAVARQRADDAGLADRVKFELIDYRDVEGTFERIVSVGMFEHVGLPNYEHFFQQIRKLLKPDGIALLHSIGRNDTPGTTNPWFRKYIFPGGYSPALSEVTPAVEASGLFMTDIEILRLHYAFTIEEWRRRFEAARIEVARLYDDRFCRMWEFYLCGSEMSFRRQGHMVFQMQLARANETVPLTRDYMYRK